MTDDTQMTTDAAVSAAERIEAMDDIREFECLDWKLVVGIDGEVREVIAVTTTGGPHVEVNLTSGTVTASWGSDSHTTHVGNEELLDHLEQDAIHQYEAN